MLAKALDPLFIGVCEILDDESACQRKPQKHQKRLDKVDSGRPGIWCPDGLVVSDAVERVCADRVDLPTRVKNKLPLTSRNRESMGSGLWSGKRIAGGECAIDIGGSWIRRPDA